VTSHVAFSSHPVAAQAAGECIGELVEAGVVAPTLAVVAVSGDFTEHLGDIADLARAVLAPSTLVGVAVAGVMAGAEQVVDAAAMGILTVELPRGGPAPRTVRGADADELAASLSTLGPDDALILFVDPFSITPRSLTEVLDTPGGPEVVAGGYLGASPTIGGNRMVLDDRTHHDGAVGVALVGGGAVTLRCTGRALLGEPLLVTAAAGPDVLELDHRGALVVYETMLIELGVEVELLSAVRRGVLGLVLLDEGADVLDRDRSHEVAVLEIDPATGALRCEPAIPVGARVLFEVCDEWSLAADLDRRLGQLHGVQDDAAHLVVSDIARVGPNRRPGPGDVAALTADRPTCPALGVVTSGVLHRRGGVTELEHDVLSLTVVGVGSGAHT
jgi:small ligand-binding sensory domain FIST